MKKTIIIAAIIVSSGLTAYCLNAKHIKTTNLAVSFKTNTTDFAAKSSNSPQLNLGTAD